ncbi:hypothetical protein KSS87_001370 [Heliosperma pusillum]|nr:hypothetical protein KSS87_001370 [Heliosperma pusillum]
MVLPFQLLTESVMFLNTLEPALMELLLLPMFCGLTFARNRWCILTDGLLFCVTLKDLSPILSIRVRVHLNPSQGMFLPVSQAIHLGFLLTDERLLQKVQTAQARAVKRRNCYR